MARLALLAVLLLAFAPSVSRVLASVSTPSLGGWMEMCTTAGLKWVDTSEQSLVKKSPLPDGGMPIGADCAYCLLAASLPIILLFLNLVFPRLRAGKIALPYAPRRRMVVNRRGLGGQGPPILL